MMSVHELFYGDAEPVRIVGNAAAQVIQSHHKAPLYDNQRNSSSYSDRNYNHESSNSRHKSSSELMAQQHNNGSFQKTISQYPHAHQHLRPGAFHLVSSQYTNSQQNPYGSSQNFSRYLSDGHDQSQYNASPQNLSSSHLAGVCHSHNHNISQQSSLYITNEPSSRQFNETRHTFAQQRRHDTMIVRLKVPICCEGCEERVIGSLSTLRGVQSVLCDIWKQKVTVTGTAAPADVLKSCKKLFKRSEMWTEERYK